MTSAEQARETQRRRFQFLEKSYGTSEAGLNKILKTYEIGGALNLGDDERERIVRYLNAAGLLEVLDAGGAIARMTRRGIDEVERALTHPDQPTRNFQPLNVIMVGQMTDSQIQQASSGAAQVVDLRGREQALLDLTESIVALRDELAAEGQLQRDLLVEVKTVRAQLESSKPSATIMGESLGSMRSILEKVAASLGVQAVLQEIDALLSH